jgi:hypothetical protein
MLIIETVMFVGNLGAQHFKKEGEHDATFMGNNLVCF